MFNLGNYYKEITNYELMKKYYLMAIDKGHVDAMFNLGYYYETYEKDYKSMKKYYLMAINKDNNKPLLNLGDYIIKKYTFNK